MSFSSVEDLIDEYVFQRELEFQSSGIMRRFFTRIGRILTGPDLRQLTEQSESLANTLRTHSDGSVFTLTSWEIKALKKSWRKLQDQQPLGGVGVAMFRGLFDRFPDSLRLFGLRYADPDEAVDDYRVRRQALVVEEMISMTIMGLGGDSGGSEQLRWPLVYLGGQHSRFAGRGFTIDYFVVFGQALLDLVAAQPLNGMHRLKRWKLLRLWRRLTHFILSCMVAGFVLARNRMIGLSEMHEGRPSAKSGRQSRIASALLQPLLEPQLGMCSISVDAKPSGTSFCGRSPGSRRHSGRRLSSRGTNSRAASILGVGHHDPMTLSLPLNF